MTFQEICEKVGYSTRSYSGRGMYDKYCLGVDVDENVNMFWYDVINYMDCNHLPMCDVLDALCCARTDQMGKGQVIYFTQIKFQKQSEEEEGEE